jgi:hypothetical protein
VGNQRYMLALAALFAFADRLADMHGHRKMVVRRYVRSPAATRSR